MWQTLIIVSLRQWAGHKVRVGATVSAIALGVAVYFAFQTANYTLLGASEVTLERMAGRANLQVTASGGGFPEAVLDKVRAVAGVKIAEPIIEVQAHTDYPDDNELLVTAVDTLGDSTMREYDIEGSQTTMRDPLIFLARKDSIMVTREFATRHHLKQGDHFALFTASGRKLLTIRGLMKPGGVGALVAGKFAVMDIYAAQLMFERGKNFDRVDIVTASNDKTQRVEQALRAALGQGFSVDTPVRRARQVEDWNFQVSRSLVLVALMALVIGGFVIFNAFSMAVGQRFREIGVLRAQGATRRAIQGMFLGEAAIMAVLGGGAGLGLGLVIAKIAIGPLNHTVGRWYGFAGYPDHLAIEPSFIIYGLLLGLLTSLAAAYWPARQAARMDVIATLRNVELSKRQAMLDWRRGVAGAALLSAGFGVAAILPVGALAFTIALIMRVVGMVMFMPYVIVAVARLLRPLMRALFGHQGALAVDMMAASPLRTSNTVMALMLGLMMVLSTGALLKSLRVEFISWIDRIINADLYVSGSGYELSDRLAGELRIVPGVARVEPFRLRWIQYGADEAQVLATDTGSMLERVDLGLGADKSRVIRMLAAGKGVLVSHNFAAHYLVKPGSMVQLHAPLGPLTTQVLAVIEDLTNNRGLLMMDRSLYMRYWADPMVDQFQVTVAPGAVVEQVRREIERATRGDHLLWINDGNEMKSFFVRVVDQALTVSYFQIFIAALIGVLSVVNSVLLSVAERQREIGVLRAIGAIRRQIRGLMMLEGIALGVAGSAMGIVAGVVASLVVTITLSDVLTGFQLPFAFPNEMAAVTIPAFTMIAAMAAWPAARQAARVRIVEAIGWE